MTDQMINTQRTIGIMVADFFDKLGEEIIAINNGEAEKQKFSNTAVVRTMENIGYACPSLSGGFNCGKSAVIAETLFGVKGGMDYYRYFEKVSRAYYALYGLEGEYRARNQRVLAEADEIRADVAA